METGSVHAEEERAEGRSAERPDEAPRDESAPARRGRFDFERGWMAVACVLLVAAAALFYLRRPSAAFVAAALGMSAWFWNVRNGIKRKHDLVKRGPRNWVPRGGDDE